MQFRANLANSFQLAAIISYAEPAVVTLVPLQHLNTTTRTPYKFMGSDNKSQMGWGRLEVGKS